jgi:hypothetical protein
MTKKEVIQIIDRAKSHFVDEQLGFPKGVTKFQAFLAIKPLLEGKLYWYALRETYDSSDDLYEYRADVKFAFESDEPKKEFLMNKSERRFLKGLPEKIRIYRGMTVTEKQSNDFGISWTLKKEEAEFFINDYQRNYATRHEKKCIHELAISKKDVVAFFNDREEFEIIYIHQSIREKWELK